jgi:hypothetical protein
MPTSREYLYQAEECLRLAENANEAFAREALLELAAKFQAIAVQLDLNAMVGNEARPCWLVCRDVAPEPAVEVTATTTAIHCWLHDRATLIPLPPSWVSRWPDRHRQPQSTKLVGQDRAVGQCFAAIRRQSVRASQ